MTKTTPSKPPIAAARRAGGSARRRAVIGYHDPMWPSTLLSLVEAWLPVMVVLSKSAVPKVPTPPPTPALNRSVAPGWPALAAPLTPKGEFPPPAVAPPPAPACPPDAGQGVICRDDVHGVGLFGPLLRPQLGLEREGAVGRVEDPAAAAAGALAAGAAGAAGCAAAFESARGRAACLAGAAGAAGRLVGGERDGYPGEGGGRRVEQAAAVAIARGGAGRRPAPPLANPPRADVPRGPRRLRPRRRRHCRRRRPGRRCRRWRDSR